MNKCITIVNDRYVRIDGMDIRDRFDTVTIMNNVFTSGERDALIEALCCHRDTGSFAALAESNTETSARCGMNKHSTWLRSEAALNEKAGNAFIGPPDDSLLSIAAEQRNAANAFDALLAACEKSLDHIQELEDAWSRGAIHESDYKGGTRSNRNTNARVILRAAIQLAQGEQL